MNEPFYDAIIVGAGVAGSVVAWKLTEAGMRVCLLERGREHPPGSFARSPAAMAKNFWDPSAGLQGLYDVWSFEGVDAIVGSGVGGTSLIYSNVLIRKDERWFVREDATPGGSYEYWPVTRDDLERHYDSVEKALRVERYPVEHEPYRSTPRSTAMRDAAEALDLDFFYPNLGVRFSNAGRVPRPGEPLLDAPGENMYGVPRYTCRLCAECNLGCNYGSKQTFDLTLLSQAKQHGLELLPRCEVRRFAPLGDRGYRVEYVIHEPEREGRPYTRGELPSRTASGRFLILAAGAFGSTFLLLRMKRDSEAFADISPMLGHRFNGNGDALSLVWRTHQRDEERTPRTISPSFGPVITSSIRVPDTRDGKGADGPGYYVQDAGYPTLLAWIIETAPSIGNARRVLRLSKRYLSGWLGLNPDTNLSAELATFFGDTSLTETTLPLLHMGRDISTGVMSIDSDNYLNVQWSAKHADDYLSRIRQSGEHIAQALRGEHIELPTALLSRSITVHPLGGAPMGRHPAEGVVDAWGQVFGYPGLYVADGAAMPGPVGPNPALTIAALAHRLSEGVIEAWRGRASWGLLGR